MLLPLRLLPFVTIYTLAATLNTSSTSDCISNNLYIVHSGDTATIISNVQTVSTRAIININGLKPDGSDLAANSTICIPLPCKTYTVQAGETCKSIAKKNSISLTAFKQWNLDLDGECKNLISKYNVCVGPAT